ncbi:MAG: glycosyltransferase, partial [Chitinivibrionales bacterium]|nr:glycosyltransferase [Chitinivibrionales bacterium]
MGASLSSIPDGASLSRSLLQDASRTRSHSRERRRGRYGSQHDKEHGVKVAFFYHSLVSDWNNGNAHFLRGVAKELQKRGCEVSVFEPADGWSMRNLIRDFGQDPLEDFKRAYPSLDATTYSPKSLDLDTMLDDIDLVIVHEWNEPEVVNSIGAHRALNTGYKLLFHDTHHRSVTKPRDLDRYVLSNYDGVLAFGESVRQQYISRGWTRAAWVWHEAADTTVFYPRRDDAVCEGDLVW